MEGVSHLEGMGEGAKRPKSSQQGSVSPRNTWRKAEEDTDLKQQQLLSLGGSMCHELALLTTKILIPEDLSTA